MVLAVRPALQRQETHRHSTRRPTSRAPYPATRPTPRSRTTGTASCARRYRRSRRKNPPIRRGAIVAASRRVFRRTDLPARAPPAPVRAAASCFAMARCRCVEQEGLTPATYAPSTGGSLAMAEHCAAIHCRLPGWHSPVPPSTMRIIRRLHSLWCSHATLPGSVAGAGRARATSRLGPLGSRRMRRTRASRPDPASDARISRRGRPRASARAACAHATHAARTFHADARSSRLLVRSQDRLGGRPQRSR